MNKAGPLMFLGLLNHDPLNDAQSVTWVHVPILGPYKVIWVEFESRQILGKNIVKIILNC